jgi:hypothetical protein
MKIFVYNLFAILVLCCASCAKKRQNISDTSTESFETLHCQNCSDNSFNPDKAPVLEYEEVKFVGLEINDSCLISFISQIEIRDSLIFILDNSIKGHFSETRLLGFV